MKLKKLQKFKYIWQVQHVVEAASLNFYYWPVLSRTTLYSLYEIK